MRTTGGHVVRPARAPASQHRRPIPPMTHRPQAAALQERHLDWLQFGQVRATLLVAHAAAARHATRRPALPGALHDVQVARAATPAVGTAVTPAVTLFIAVTPAVTPAVHPPLLHPVDRVGAARSTRSTGTGPTIPYLTAMLRSPSFLALLSCYALHLPWLH